MFGNRKSRLTEQLCSCWLVSSLSYKGMLRLETQKPLEPHLERLFAGANEHLEGAEADYVSLSLTTALGSALPKTELSEKMARMNLPCLLLFLFSV